MLIVNWIRGEDYKLWWERHKDNCSKNFDGSSIAMEAAAAKILWQRSVSTKKGIVK